MSFTVTYACPDPISRHANGVTIVAADCAVAGQTYNWNGENWYVARNSVRDIQNKIFGQRFPANRIVTTKVTTMRELFWRRTTFNQDIGNWDVANVIDMQTMFGAAQQFNQDIRHWDTSKVTNMKWMFFDARSFNQPI